MARLFDASDEYASASPPVTVVPLTLAGWVYPTDLTGNNIVGWLGHASPGVWTAFYLNITSGGVLDAVAAESSTFGTASATGTIGTGSWQHVAGVFTSATSRTAYRDGGNSGTNTANVTPTGANLNSIYLAAENVTGPPGNNFTGRIAEFGVWDAALNADEIAALAKGISPLLIRPTSLVFYAPLIGRTSPEVELIAANNLTLSGTTSAADHPRIYYPSVSVLLPVGQAVSPLLGTGPSLFRGRLVPSYDDEEVNRFEFWPAVSAGADVTRPLTGVSSTASPGSLSLTHDNALSGLLSTSSVGIVTANNSVAVSSNASTTEVGSLSFTESGSVGLTNVLATSGIGTLAPDTTVVITGNQATGSVGTVTASIGVSAALTGIQATGNVGTLGVSISISLSGVSITSAVGSVLLPAQAQLSGVQSSTAVGDLGFTKSGTLALTGVSTTGEVGTAQASTTKAVSGLGATSAVGSFGVQTSPVLSSIQVSGNVGSLGIDLATSLSGVQSTTAVGSVFIGTGLIVKSPTSVTLGNNGELIVTFNDGSTSTALTSSGKTSVTIDS